MKAGLFFILPILCLSYSAYSQKYTLVKSSVQFFSDATIEDIKSENTKSSGLLNLSNGDAVFSIPIKDFEFDKALMKDHFNEKYLESHKFPKAIFQGKFLDLKKDVLVEQPVKVIGKLTIHGVTKEITIPGTMEWKGNQIIARSTFTIRLEDYNVAIPQLLWQNIAEEVEVTVEFIYQPL